MLSKNENREILVSVMMTVYNDISILPIAIESVRKQTFDKWELLILDNSDKNIKAWELLEKYQEADERIHIFKSPGHGNNINVGWTKGSSILLEHAKGMYVTFLSADDFIDEHSFEWIHNEYEKSDPDVIWVGNTFVSYDNDKFNVLKIVTPNYKLFDGEDKVFEIDYVFRNVYYNSMFHYEKVEFLKKNNIDFFEPYYSDCAAMTAALCNAEKMIVLDKNVYYLTMNTSQTSGKVTLDFYKIFSLQWQLIRDVFLKNNCTDNNIIIYAAIRIYNNFAGNLELILNNADCRDKYMNEVKCNHNERLMQIKKALSDKYIRELFFLSGKSDYMQSLDRLIQESEIEY